MRGTRTSQPAGAADFGPRPWLDGSFACHVLGCYLDDIIGEVVSGGDSYTHLSNKDFKEK